MLGRFPKFRNRLGLPALAAILCSLLGASNSRGQLPGGDLSLVPPVTFIEKKEKPALSHIGIGTLDNKRILAPGDRLSFRIAEEGDEPVLVTVTSSGEIDFPYVGRVMASGRTCKAVADEVRRLLEKSFYHSATVGLALETASSLPMGTYFVTGQVMSQGARQIPRDREVTVSEAILEAGGFADFADRRRVHLIRPTAQGKPERFTIDVKAILERGDTRKDMVIQPGDYIVVPERMFNF